jgi:hypothetical protein
MIYTAWWWLLYVAGTVAAIYSKLLHWQAIFSCMMYIQGVSRLVDVTAGGDFLGLCDQKSSYKHVSDFGRLRSYGHFLIPVHALVWTASYESMWNAGKVGWVDVRLASVYCMTEQLARFTTERQPVLRPAVAFSKTSCRHSSIRSFKRS